MDFHVKLERPKSFNVNIEKPKDVRVSLGKEILNRIDQEQVDLAQTDASQVDFVNNKSTKYLLNEGEDGSSPYVSQSQVEEVKNSISSDIQELREEFESNAITDEEKKVWNAKANQSDLDLTNLRVINLEENKATINYVDSQINNVREVAEGKTKSFTVSTLTDLGTLLGIDTSVVSDEYEITYTTITYRGKTYELKQGDLFIVVDTSVPDYWISIDDMKIYKMETTKVDLTDYVKNTDYATSSKGGTVKIHSDGKYGIGINNSGVAFIQRASISDIDSKTVTNKAIVPSNADYSFKVSMTTNSLNWTDEEKTKARLLIDAVGTSEFGELISDLLPSVTRLI